MRKLEKKLTSGWLNDDFLPILQAKDTRYELAPLWAFHQSIKVWRKYYDLRKLAKLDKNNFFPVLREDAKIYGMFKLSSVVKVWEKCYDSWKLLYIISKLGQAEKNN